MPSSEYQCERALDDIAIPEEDSRLHARARVDFGQVPIGSFSAAIAGNFYVRMHVPRALQQQISGNGFVGSVLGGARISADISERVGDTSQVKGRGIDLCLFVDFHEARRGNWMVDLRMLRGGHLRVPVRIDTTRPLSKAMPIAVVSVGLKFDEEAAGSFGPITIPSGSVSDLWRSIRDQVRNMLAARVEGIVVSEVARIRASLRTARMGDSSEGLSERQGGRARCSLI